MSSAAAQSCRIREATSADLQHLWHALAMAAREPTVDAAKKIPMVALHLEGWRRPCDFGFMALGVDDAFIGAAWARQFDVKETPAFFVNNATPEVPIGVTPAWRGQGVGEQLMKRLMLEARTRERDLCLNVREDNAAARLYTRLGFERVPRSEVTNRTGGTSFGMMWTWRL